MPYNQIKSDVTKRFLEVGVFLGHVKNIEDLNAPPKTPPVEYKILKGLFYVHLYACVEYAINTVVLQTITLIKAKQIRYSHFENKFHTVALYSQLQAIRDCNPKVFLDKSANIFLQIDSSEVAEFEESSILKYIQNIWGKTFNQLTKTIGISNFNIEPRTIAIFDEIVDNRNKVAHGRDSCESVGSAPKYLDLKAKYDTVYTTIHLYIEHFEIYYKSLEYVKQSERTGY